MNKFLPVSRFNISSTLRQPSRKHLGLLTPIMLAPLHMTTLAAEAPAPKAQTAPQMVASVTFNPSFLNGTNVDISRFENGNPVLPGNYRVDLYINDYRVAREQISFRSMSKDENARPCFTRALLERMNVDVAKLESTGTKLEGDCIDLAAIVPGAQTNFDTAELRLDVSVPQASMLRHARGFVSPELWDEGVTALTLGYSFNAYQTDDDSFGSSKSAYLGLNSGLNIGGWRLRNQSSLSWADDGNGNHFQNIANYAQHDITPWESQLTIGDSFTSGELYDSTGFRGAQMATDDRMRPDSLRGYAPIVRGMAETNAKVEVRQNGYLIYETTVAPGAFEIDDLYATGYGGDLDVTVTEADGRQRTFSVPYASVPRLLREGTWRYSATAGQVRNDLLETDAPYFVEGTYQHGINNWLTGYGGVQASDEGFYRSFLLGSAFNTPVGALSLDLTHADTRFSQDGGRWTGRSARVTYSKSIPATNTDFALAAYRYSSREYLNLWDATAMDDRIKSRALSVTTLDDTTTPRSRFQVTLNQRLGERAGSLYLSGSRNDYWKSSSIDTTYQVGYNNSFGSLSYSVTAARTRDFDGQYDNQYYLSVSLPLGNSSAGSRAPRLSLDATHDQGGDSMRAGVSSNLGEHNQFNYNVYTTTAENRDDNVGGSASWRTPVATLGASYSYSSNHQQASASAAGAVVVHPGGITLAPQLGETIGIAEAKGAEGARLSNDGISKVDGRGYMVATNLTPYRLNDVTLDPKGTSLDVELQTSRLQVAPRAGAVVALKFETNTGHAILIRGKQNNGEVLPFGADVLDAKGNSVGLVGQHGQLFARTQENNGSLMVRWNGGQQCLIDYQLPERRDNSITTVDAVCR
ncbi:Outer membrane usher protein HtrE precursor [compost metagenome]